MGEFCVGGTEGSGGTTVNFFDVEDCGGYFAPGCEEECGVG